MIAEAGTINAGDRYEFFSPETVRDALPAVLWPDPASGCFGTEAAR
jgi:hypothetical protein